MRIEVLFPEICNLYGDLFNAEYLRRSCPEIEIVNTSINSEPLFSSTIPDMIYMGCMTERGQEMAVAKLLTYKERITGLANDGALFFLTGNAGELFGTHIETENAGNIDCLGILPVYAKRRMMNRYNSLYIGKFHNMDIVGFKGQFSHSYGDNSDCYFIETTRGDGINPGSKFEGIWKNNLFSTYIIGPLLPLNPPLAKYLLDLMGVDSPLLEFEKECCDAYNTRVKEFSEPTRGFLH